MIVARLINSLELAKNLEVYKIIVSYTIVRSNTLEKWPHSCFIFNKCYLSLMLINVQWLGDFYDFDDNCDER